MLCFRASASACRCESPLRVRLPIEGLVAYFYSVTVTRFALPEASNDVKRVASLLLSTLYGRAHCMTKVSPV